MREVSLIERTASLLIALSVSFALTASADEQPAKPETQHQMMKDCMSKQKASDSGRLKEDMKKSCKEVTKPEKENADQAVPATPAEPAAAAPAPATP